MMHARTAGAIGIAVIGLTLAARADTLVLRDGTRIDGNVLSIRDGIVEFDARGRGLSGSGRGRMRVDREDVARIEFDTRTDNRRGSDFDDARRPSGLSDDSRDTRRPSGLREREISVDSWLGWKDTGIEVRSGQAVYFSANGRVRWGPSRQDGPAGERNSPRNDARPIPSRPAASLIGRVGNGDEHFFIGDEQGAIRMRSSGRLYLGVNDDFLKDNTGSFRVVVYY